ncbi:hypothetical protein LTR97_010367 [Elasticomyces elasticus]|uniref:Uncharacterized protein n=1 Tax=Elasticomyces elasticus TaxID=574655 RepID=A0AAN7VZP8_9PEZI|nr:hypothetical protein LTR97_010367 [Elasticomyces elasticus]
MRPKHGKAIRLRNLALRGREKAQRACKEAEDSCAKMEEECTKAVLDEQGAGERRDEAKSARDAAQAALEDSQKEQRRLVEAREELDGKCETAMQQLEYITAEPPRSQSAYDEHVRVNFS